MTHQLVAVPIGEDRILLRIDVYVTNVGDVLLQLEHVKVRVNQILPVREDILAGFDVDGGINTFNVTNTPWPNLVDQEFDWDIERPEIEPSEIDEFNYDFIIPSEAKVIEIYTYFTNVKKRKTKRRKTEIGWGHTSIYDLTDPMVLPNHGSNC